MADGHRCPVATCGVTAAGNPLWFGVRAHLRDAHKAADVAKAVLAANRLRGCCHCGALFHSGRSTTARLSLAEHVAGCAARPGAPAATLAARAVGSPPAVGGAAAASPLATPPPSLAADSASGLAGVAAPPLGVCPLVSCGAAVGAGDALVEHLRTAHTAVDVPPARLEAAQLGGCRHCHRLFSVVRTASGHRPLRSHEPNCPSHPLLQGGGGRAAAVAATTAAGAAPATAADLASWATRTCCVVGGCTTTFRGAVTPRTLPAHLARSHKLAAVPAEWVRALRLAGCRYCGRPYRTVVDWQRRTSLSRNEARRDERPPRELDA